MLQFETEWANYHVDGAHLTSVCCRVETMLAWFNHLTKRLLFDERTRLGPGAGMNEVGVAAAVLIGSMVIAGVLLAGVAGAHTTHPCPCRYSGGVAPPGAVICLDVDGKRSLARCEMMLNNPSWRFLDAPCPIASLTRRVTPNGGSQPDQAGSRNKDGPLAVAGEVPTGAHQSRAWMVRNIASQVYFGFTLGAAR